MSEIRRLFLVEPLWREVLGSRLRGLRGERDETLAQTAERAGISPQYLSEVERGRKEPSSEMIAALAGALGITVADLMAGAAQELRRAAAAMIVSGSGVSGSGVSGSGVSGSGVSGAGVSGTAGAAVTPIRPAGRRPSGPVALAA